MRTPFEQPVPKSLILRVQEYARDLAWGVDNYLWKSRLETVIGDKLVIPNADAIRFLVKNINSFNFNDPDDIENIRKFNNVGKQFINKWFVLNTTIQDMVANKKIDFDNITLDLVPTLRDMTLWEYISKDEYIITQQAFELLKQPVSSPSVFLSYRRVMSSTFALAIEARLRVVGHEDVFIDKKIEAGDDWLDVLMTRIEHCDYFVLLVDDDVFAKSPYTEREFDHALKLGKTIIPIVHPDVDISKLPPKLTNIQSIVCRGKASAATYEAAINELLNILGYATY